MRVVCNNTLTIAVNGVVSAIKVPHNTRFDAQAVKQQLGIAVSQWDGFMYRMRTLAERKVKSHEAMAYFLRVLCEVDPNSSPSHLQNRFFMSSLLVVTDWTLKSGATQFRGGGAVAWN